MYWLAASKPSTLAWRLASSLGRRGAFAQSLSLGPRAQGRMRRSSSTRSTRGCCVARTSSDARPAVGAEPAGTKDGHEPRRTAPVLGEQAVLVNQEPCGRVRSCVAPCGPQVWRKCDLATPWRPFVT